MSQLHVAPENDTKDHVVNLDEECWCDPQVQDEGKCKVMIHKPSVPMAPGSKFQIMKVLLLEEKEEPCYVGVVDKVIVKQPPFVAPPEFAKGHTHVP